MTDKPAATSEPNWALTIAETLEFAGLLDTAKSMRLPGHQEREWELYDKAARGGEQWAISALIEIARLAAQVQQQSSHIAELERYLERISDMALSFDAGRADLKREVLAEIEKSEAENPSRQDIFDRLKRRVEEME